MAYRGGDTDPLDVIIQQRRTSRRKILFVAAIWLLPGLVQMDFSGLRGIYTPPPTPATAPAFGLFAPEVTTPGSKMSATRLEQMLAGSAAPSQTPMNPTCLLVPPVSGGWDYVCSYSPFAQSPGRLKVGVRVSGISILQVSPAVRFEAPLPSPFQGR
jgi:hypothetical protein